MKLKEENPSPGIVVNGKQNPEVSTKQKGKHKKKIKGRMCENGSCSSSEASSKETIGSRPENDKTCDNENNGTLEVDLSLVNNHVELLSQNDNCTQNGQSPTNNSPCSSGNDVMCSNMNEEIVNKPLADTVTEVPQVQNFTISAVANSQNINNSNIGATTSEVQNIPAENGLKEDQLLTVQNYAAEAENPEGCDKNSPLEAVNLHIPLEAVNLHVPVEAPNEHVPVEASNVQVSVEASNLQVLVVEASDLQVSVEAAACVLEYYFEIPQQLCGLLIGRNGRHVKYIHECTKIDITVVNHPYSSNMKLCRLKGSESQIDQTLVLLRHRFPLEKYENLSFLQVNALSHEYIVGENLRLYLPEAIHFDVVLSATISAGHFFVQQPTHPAYHSLRPLLEKMSEVYGDGSKSPVLPHFSRGNVCAAPASGNGWFRVEIVSVSEDMTACTVKYLDYGGFCTLSTSVLRQIRYDFMITPFLASECYLGNVTFPNGEETWSPAANDFFKRIAQSQILQGFIVAYSPDGIPYVHLYSIQGPNCTFINRELVNHGMAEWISHNTPTEILNGTNFSS